MTSRRAFLAVASKLAFVAALLAGPGAAQTSARVKDLYRPGEERVWTFQQDGKRIGWSTFRYEGTVDLAGIAVQRFTGLVHVDALPAQGVPSSATSASS
jgi:hypothetical protein